MQPDEATTAPSDADINAISLTSPAGNGLAASTRRTREISVPTNLPGLDPPLDESTQLMIRQLREELEVTRQQRETSESARRQAEAKVRTQLRATLQRDLEGTPDLGKPNWTIMTDPKEYGDWKVQFMSAASTYGVSNVLLGDQGDMDDETWRVNQIRLHNRLLSCTKGEAFKRVKDFIGDTDCPATKAWKALEEKFGQVTQSEVSTLIRSFYNMPKLSQLSQIVEYIDDAKRRRRKLEEVGIKTNEVIFIYFIIEALPDRVKEHLINLLPVQSNLMDAQTIEGILDAIKLRCKNHMGLLNTQIVESAKAAQVYNGHRPAISSTNKRPREDRNGAKETRTCNNCKRPGHLKADCFKAGGGAYKEKSKTNAEKCNNCGRSGHSTNECFRDGGGAYRAGAPNQKKPRVEHGMEADQIMMVEEEAASCDAGPDKSTSWLIDSGATSHMTPFETDIAKHEPSSKNVRIANGHHVPVASTGTIRCEVKTEHGAIMIQFQEALYVPELTKRLISATRLVQKGSTLVLSGTGSHIVSPNGAKIPISNDGSGYLMPVMSIGPSLEEAYVTSDPMENVESDDDMKINNKHASSYSSILHVRFGHANNKTIREMIKKGRIIGYPVSSLNKIKATETCQVCMMAKSQRAKTVTESVDRSEAIANMIHTDIYGPITPESRQGNRYMIIFVDDKSRMRWVYFMKKKSETLSKIKLFYSEEIRPRGLKVNYLRMDGAKEYLASKGMETFCVQEGIKRTFSAPYHQEQNGVAERSWRTIVEKGRALRLGSGLANIHWQDAYATAVYVINRTTTRVNNKKRTPYQEWTGVRPDVSNLRAFGCPCFVHTERGTGHNKLDAKAWQGIFVGYSLQSNAYLVYNTNTRVTHLTINVRFDEGSLWSDAHETKAETADIEIGQSSEYESDDDSEVDAEPELRKGSKRRRHDEDSLDETHSPSVKEPDAVRHRHSELHVTLARNLGDTLDGGYWDLPPDQADKSVRSKRNKKISNSLNRGPLIQAQIAVEQAMIAEAMVPGRVTIRPIDPLTYEQAIRGPDAKEWYKAMDKEYETIMKMGVWKVVPLPPGRKVVGSKWVYKTKLDQDGKISRFKARFVAQGFSQVPGVDYFEITAPVCKLTTMRMLIALGTMKGWEIRQSDVTNAYLHASLDEEHRSQGDEPLHIFVKQPKGFVTGDPTHVLKVSGNLYGTKQGARMWNIKLRDTALKFGLTQSQADKCLFYMRNGTEELYLAIYVDDSITTGTHDMLMNFETELSRAFEVKHEGPVTWILGLKVERDLENKTTILSQSSYIKATLEKFSMEESYAVHIPMRSKPVLTSKDGPQDEGERKQMENVPYRSAIGSLSYAAVCTRPDIATAVNKLAQFCQNPGEAHWKAVKQVLRYLRGTEDLGLTYNFKGQTELVLHGITDADWGGCLDTRRSTTGYVFYLNDAPISWASKKQKAPAQSSTEAEYYALGLVCMEAAYLRQLCVDFGISVVGPTLIESDSEGAMNFSKGDGYNSAMKHIDLKWHLTKHMVEEKQVDVQHIMGTKNTADILTKPLERVLFTRHRGKLMGLTQLEEGKVEVVNLRQPKKGKSMLKK